MIGCLYPACKLLLTNRSVNSTIVIMVPKGKRTKAGDRTRAAILEATVTLLGREGPDAFSASTLAKEAGVSKATLFHHFGTIDDIPHEALQHLFSQAISQGSGNSQSARDYLQELGQQVILLARKRRNFLRANVVFLTKAIFDSRLRQRMAVGALQMHRLMTQALSEKLPKTVSASEIEATARMVEIALDGLMFRLAVIRSAEELAESKRAWTLLIELLLDHVEAK